MRQSKFVSRGKSAAPRLPSARSGHSLLYDNVTDTTFLVGGYCDLGPCSDVWNFDHQSSKWALLDKGGGRPGSTPLPRLEFDACILNNKIYLFAGFESDGNDVSILNDLWSFDIQKRTWQLLAAECACPERSGHVAVAIDNHRMIIQGGDCMGPRDDCWLYDSKTNIWLQIQPAGPHPSPRSMHAAVFCAGSSRTSSSPSLVVFGGVTQQQVRDTPTEVEPVYLNDLWVLSLHGPPEQWIWRMISCSSIAPSPRDLPALVALDDGVILYGGFGMREIDEDNSEDEGADGDLDPESEEENDEEEDQEEGEDACAEDVQIDVDDDDAEEQGHRDDVHTDVSIVPPVKFYEASETTKEASAVETEVSKTDSESNIQAGSVAVVKEGKERIEDSAADDDDNDNNDDDEDEDDDGEIAIEYLDDAWFINLETSEAQEFDIQHLSASQIGGGGRSTAAAAAAAENVSNNSNSSSNFPPCRGSRLVNLGGRKLFAFGGFDGDGFLSSMEYLDIQSLRESLSLSTTTASTVAAAPYTADPTAEPPGKTAVMPRIVVAAGKCDSAGIDHNDSSHLSDALMGGLSIGEKLSGDDAR